MTGPGAFSGDPAVKAALLAALDRHVKEGTLLFDGTIWDGVRGSPLGIAIEGDDLQLYSDRFGYPLPLVALLDPLARQYRATEDAIEFVRCWIETPAVGAYLDNIPAALIRYLLTPFDIQGACQPLVQELLRLHGLGTDQDQPSREDWAAVRSMIVRLDAEPLEEAEKRILSLCETVAWPANRGCSILNEALSAARRIAASTGLESWTQEDQKQSDLILQRLWNDTEEARAAGEQPDFPALFHAEQPELAARFEENLRLSNAAYLQCGLDFADRCLALFAAAPVSAASHQPA
ncbi:MAG: hypothetical protein E2598_11315 [Sphingobium sp.]|nr:hypothetical protein [Sphingobium sp.]